MIPLSLRDTIVARATPPGIGSIAVVRMSGERALAIAEALFRPLGEGTRRVADLPDRTLTLGTLFSAPLAPPPSPPADPPRPDATPSAPLAPPPPPRPLDTGLIALWRAPRSYTGETVVEFHLHGGTRLVEAALEALCRQGARPAEPGEFTRRAFLNGRLDLARAEAVLDLVQAQTDRAARCALAQLHGGLSERLGALRERLVAAAAEIEAAIDFPDEDLPEADRRRLGTALDEALRTLDRLLDDARRGRPLRDGARIAVAGRPNVGKSSLLNALVGRDRAIVAPHPGTTRDTIEAEIDLDGIPVTLVDMAGLRPDPEAIEALGIQRAHQEIQAATLVVFLLDGAHPLAEADREAFRLVRDHPHLVVVNKNDLPPAFDMDDIARAFASPRRIALLSISAKTREGLERLESELSRALAPPPNRTTTPPSPAADAAATPAPPECEGAETPLVANARHAALLETARANLRRAAEGLAGRLAFELVAVDVRDCLDALGRVTGHAELSEEVLDSIFAAFCIGK